jgi:hypothetical protein
MLPLLRLTFVLLIYSSGNKAVILPKPAFHYHSGNWHYDPPQSGVQQFGQYVYISPMNKTCLRNLTIVVHLPICSGNVVNQSYGQSDLCVPYGLELPAWLIDQLNSRPDILQDTCLQLSSFKIDYFSAVQEGSEREALIEALTIGNQKHGIVGFADMDQFQAVASGTGLPYIESETQGYVIRDYTNNRSAFKQTLFVKFTKLN